MDFYIVIFSYSPVLYGNKWIANKWIKWLANHENFPCLLNNEHYCTSNHNNYKPEHGTRILEESRGNLADFDHGVNIGFAI